MKRDRSLNYLVVVVLTAFVCWVLFRSSLRVESVHDVGSGYLVEVSICGETEVHELSK